MNSSTDASNEPGLSESNVDDSKHAQSQTEIRREQRQSLAADMRGALDAGDLQAARRCIEEAERQSPDSMQTYLFRAQLLAHEDETESALTLAREGLQNGGAADVDVVRTLLSMVASMGGAVTVRRTPLNAAIRDLLEPSQLLSIARQLDAYGDTARARTVGGWVISAQPASRSTVEATLGTTAEQVTAGVDWDADFICIEEPGSERAIVVFCGLNHQAAISLPELYESLRPLKAHFVALRDMERLLFLGDLPYLGADPEESAALLRTRLEAMGASRVFVIGASSGGFGALLYGSLMKADAIVGYGAIAQIELPGDSRRLGVKRRIQAKAKRWMDPPAERLRALDPPIPVLLNYGEKMDLDVRQAQSLACIPGVRLQPFPGSERHDVILDLIESDRFLPELREFLGTVDPSLLDPPGRDGKE